VIPREHDLPASQALLVCSAGRGFWKRLAAHVLIRLLILSPLPPHAQLTAALFPASLLWPFLAQAEASPEPARNGPGEPAREPLPDSVALLSEGPGGACASVWRIVQVMRSDLLIIGNQVIAATGGTAYVVSYANPLAPLVVAQLSNVGSRLALTDDNLLLSTNATYINNPNDPLRGLHVMALGSGTFINRVAPTPIVVSASNEVFRNVELGYKTVPPDPLLTQAEVTIDVQGGGRVATLPGTLTGGQGQVVWPAGTVVNPSLVYEARARVERDGQPLTAFPKRLLFERVPLAMLVQDRLLRVQFALPEQGLFEESRYAVDVFVADAGGAFPEAPSFTVDSAQMQQAFPNLEESWPQADGPESSRLWFTRKLDRMELPPGTNTQIRRQAFEIATVLARYAAVRVVVRSETSGQELRREQVDVVEHAVLADLVTRINLDIRRSGGEPLSAQAMAAGAAPSAASVGEALERLAGLTARALISLNNFNNRFTKNVLLGMYDGFVETAKGDLETIVYIKTAFTQDPRVTARAIAIFFEELWAALPNQAQLAGWIGELFEKADNFGNPRLDQALMFASDTGAYYGGYLTGLIIEQALTTALVTAGLAAVTAKVAGLGGTLGPPIRGALNAIKVPLWLAQVAKRVAVLIRAVGYALQGLARVGRITGQLAGEVLKFGLQHRDAMVLFFTKYKKVDKLLEVMGEVVSVSRELAGRLLHWLTIVDQMAEEAGVRFGRWVGNRSVAATDAWLSRWTALASGKRAVKDAFEAHAGLDNAAEGVAHALVAGANLPHPNPATNYAKAYVEKYGFRTNETLGPLKTGLDDARYTDSAIGQGVKDLSDPDMPALSPEAVEGAVASILQECAI
jgi:hypothetical protein